MLLHGLEEGRLGAGARAVDLVGHEELGEDRSLDEPERAPPVGSLVEDLRTEDVGGHQVGGELDAAGIEPEDAAQGLDELGLGEARHADEQAVAARQERDEAEVDDVLLAEDHRVDRLAGLSDRLKRRFRAARRSRHRGWWPPESCWPSWDSPDDAGADPPGVASARSATHALPRTLSFRLAGPY